MITKDQVELAKILWEQSKQSALHAHESWRLLTQSHSALINSLRTAGFPFTEATKQFENLMEEHSKQYKAALDHMDKMAIEYGEILEQIKKASV